MHFIVVTNIKSNITPYSFDVYFRARQRILPLKRIDSVDVYTFFIKSNMD